MPAGERRTAKNSTSRPEKNVSRRQMSCGRASTFSKKPESRRAHTVLLYIELSGAKRENESERPIAAFQHLFCSKPTAGRARYLITGADFLPCTPLSGNEIILLGMSSRSKTLSVPLSHPLAACERDALVDRAKAHTTCHAKVACKIK